MVLNLPVECHGAALNAAGPAAMSARGRLMHVPRDFSKAAKCLDICKSKGRMQKVFSFDVTSRMRIDSCLSCLSVEASLV